MILLFIKYFFNGVLIALLIFEEIKEVSLTTSSGVSLSIYGQYRQARAYHAYLFKHQFTAIT